MIHVGMLTCTLAYTCTHAHTHTLPMAWDIGRMES